jgi:hypothetical protein
MLQEPAHATQISDLPLTVREDIAPHYENRASSPNRGGRQAREEIELEDLVFRIVAAFRWHPHINNVLTHISGANWSQVEQALRVILDPCARSHDLSPLTRNIVELMCADRGVTGRILKPFYRERLVTLLGDRVASRLIAHVTCLFLEYEVAERTVTSGNLTNVFVPTSSEGAE